MEINGYAGTLYDSARASGARVSVFPRGESFEVRTREGEALNIPYAGMKVSVTGMDDRYLLFQRGAGGDASKLILEDKAVISHLQALGASRTLLDELEKCAATKKRRKMGRLGVLGGLLVVLAGLVLGVWGLFSWAVDAAVQQIPPEWEKELGRTTAAGVLEEHRVCSDPDLNRAVGEIGSRLVMAIGATPYEWHIRVLDAQEVNAFALPGGYIFVNRGLIEKSGDAHEAAGVLAHEVQHVLHRHGIKNTVRQVGIMIILWAVLGDAGEVERFLAGNAAGLASMTFSRDQEREADEGGVDLIYRAGLDPTGLARFMEVLSAQEGLAGAIPSFLSTHPASDERAEELGELVARRGQAQIVPLTADWASLKGRCDPITVSDPDAI